MAEFMEGEKKWHQSSWSECEIWRENIVNWLAAGTSKLNKKNNNNKKTAKKMWLRLSCKTINLYNISSLASGNAHTHDTSLAKKNYEINSEWVELIKCEWKWIIRGL